MLQLYPNRVDPGSPSGAVHIAKSLSVRRAMKSIGISALAVLLAVGATPILRATVGGDNGTIRPFRLNINGFRRECPSLGQLKACHARVSESASAIGPTTGPQSRTAAAADAREAASRGDLRSLVPSAQRVRLQGTSPRAKQSGHRPPRAVLAAPSDRRHRGA